MTIEARGTDEFVCTHRDAMLAVIDQAAIDLMELARYARHTDMVLTEVFDPCSGEYVTVRPFHDITDDEEGEGVLRRLEEIARRLLAASEGCMAVRIPSGVIRMWPPKGIDGPRAISIGCPDPFS